MKKSDLIPGKHFIKDTTDTIYLVAEDLHCNLWGIDVGLSNGFYTSGFKLLGDDTDESNSTVFISEVLELRSPCSQRMLLENLKSIWKATEVKEVTMAEVEKKFGCKVKIIKED